MCFSSIIVRSLRVKQIEGASGLYSCDRLRLQIWGFLEFRYVALAARFFEFMSLLSASNKSYPS